MKKVLLFAFAFVPCLACAQGYYDDSSSGISSFLIMLLVFIVIFILCRELVCWYYKINKSISNQEEVIKLLKEINEKLKKE